MPIEALNNRDEVPNNPNEILGIDDIRSQDLTFILGASIKDGDFQFIAREDADTFASMREGAFGTDTDESGLNKVFRKINGQRQYLVYESEARAFLTTEIAKLKPITLSPAAGDELPTSTSEQPLYRGRRIIFLSNGVIGSTEVQAGGLAFVQSDIPEGATVTWNDLEYNGPGTADAIDITPISLRDFIRLDGGAGSDGVTEKAVADAIISTRDEINNNISGVESRLTTGITDLQGRVSATELNDVEQNEQITGLISASESLTREVRTLEAQTETQESRIGELESEPKRAEETVTIGDGASTEFKIPLRNKFVGTPDFTWKIIASGGRYNRMVSSQGGYLTEEDGVCYFNIKWNNLPPLNSQFRVVVKGYSSGTIELATA